MSNDTEILEGNKLIAEFMNIEKCTDKDHASNPCYYLEGQYSKINFAKYHSSWDWLIPVVEKLEKQIGLWIRIERDYIIVCKFIDYSGVIIQENTFTHDKGKIYSVWLAVVGAIKWYNNNKPEVK